MKKFKSTDEVKIPDRLIDQIIGQDKATEIIKKAAKQHRNVLLIGSPGTGKTLLAQAMAELLPAADLEDVLTYKNVNDDNKPIIKVVKTYPNAKEALANGKALGDGQGRQIVQKEKMNGKVDMGKQRSLIIPILIVLVVVAIIAAFLNILNSSQIIFLGAIMLGIFVFGAAALFVGTFRRAGAGVLPGMFDTNEPKLIVDNTGLTHAPFVEATGAKAGALFGDVKHDPLQSGGLGTPPHMRVDSGAVHKASKGVLFIDEVSNLEAKSQQELLTAMQEKRYSITGQSELSSGAMVRTEPVPCDFLLVAAGNLQDVPKMHPALRSRIRGYGYEVYMEDTMPDTERNREDIIRFIAQEIKKDGKIPPFSYDACMVVIEEAKRRSGRKNRLTLILRDLGGIIRAAGDIAREKGRKIVAEEDVYDSFKVTKPLEAQFVEQSLDYRKDYQIFKSEGYAIGRVNGLAVVGSSYLSSGIVLPIVAEVTKASSRTEGKLIPTGKLGTIAREAVKNTGAIIKRHMNMDMTSYDIHVQFVQTYEGVEGDSASISIAVAVISALEGIPVSQEIAMTGSLSVRGDVLPVGGVSNKVTAAIGAGMKSVLIPNNNAGDVNIDKKNLKKIKIIPVKNIADVLQYALKKSKRRDEIIKKLRKYIETDKLEREPLEA